jgi:hypothetical protein
MASVSLVFCFVLGTSAAQLDALQQQLEEVNGRLLRSCASELVELMLTDIQQPPQRGGMPQVCMPQRLPGGG